MAATSGFPTGAVREGLNTLIAENWSSTVIDLLFPAMPAVQVIFGKNGTKTSHEGLGVPNAGMLLTGMPDAKMRKRQILSSFEYQPIIHHLIHGRGDGRVIGTHASNPSVSSWETSGPERRFVRPLVKWFDYEQPCKVSNEMIDHTKRAAAGERNGWEAIGDLLRVERNDKTSIVMEEMNELLWGTFSNGGANRPSTTGKPTSESDQKWDAFHSFAEALKEDNTYCGVDRSDADNAYWRGNYTTDAIAPVFRDIIRNLNYGGINNSSGNPIKLADRFGPLDCLFVGGDLFSIALSEADAKGVGGQVIRAGETIPNFGQFGFKRDTVRIDNTVIIYDPECPAGHLFGMKPRTWTLAIYPGHNFAQSRIINEEDLGEGRDKAHTWHISLKAMLVCEAPSENFYATNVG